jgi:hypothetical protein
MMNRLEKTLFASAVLLGLLTARNEIASALGAQGSGDNHEEQGQGSTFALDSMDGLEVQTIKEDGVEVLKAKAEVARYRGTRAVRIVNHAGLKANGAPAGSQTIAILKSTDFKDGTIEADVVGLPREGAPADVRGFVGIAFRVQGNGPRYEGFYLRMTNGRAEDQLQRNHATQYISHPEFPWKRLRTENPGVFESYVELEAGEWTKIKIVVAGTKAKLYVNAAVQPCLIVNDLKLGESHGQIALWTGSDTDAYFSNLTVK